MITATNERAAALIHSNVSVNEKGHLCFAGMDTVELAKKHGTALYLIDENRIRSNARTYIDAMEKYFGKDKSPRQMKDQIMALLDDWKAKQPPELGKSEKKTDKSL